MQRLTLLQRLLRFPASVIVQMLKVSHVPAYTNCKLQAGEGLYDNALLLF